MNTESKSLERLIAEGVALTRQKREIDAKLRCIEWQLEERFECRRTAETLVAEAGSATRVVENHTSIAPGHLRDVKLLLGDAYAHLLREEYPMTPTPELLALLRNRASSVGRAIRENHIVTEQVVRIRFTDPLGTIAVSDGPHSEIIQLHEEDPRQHEEDHQ